MLLKTTTSKVTFQIANRLLYRYEKVFPLEFLKVHREFFLECHGAPSIRASWNTLDLLLSLHILFVLSHIHDYVAYCQICHVNAGQWLIAKSNFIYLGLDHMSRFFQS